jgi:hypothetical protein
LLKESQIEYDNSGVGDMDPENGKLPGCKYVGADVVSVLMIENDGIYGVIVHSTDTL